MIKDHQKLRVPDENKEKDFFIDVNWNPKDSKTNECKLLRVTFPNGDVALVKREHFNAILFAIGTAEDQRKLIPQKQMRVKWYETVVSVKATKDISRGESITFPIKLSLPAVEEEVLGELKREYVEKQLRKRLTKSY